MDDAEPCETGGDSDRQIKQAWKRFWKVMRRDCGNPKGHADLECINFCDAVAAFEKTDPSVAQINAFTRACKWMSAHSYS